MKGLKTLIKLHRRRLDELRQQMGLLEEQKNQLIEISVKLSEELEHELKLAYDQPEMANFYGDFADRIRKRQEEIIIEVRNINQKILVLTSAIAVEFSETKKFEIVLEQRLKEQKEAQERRESITLDDIGVEQYRRARADEGSQN